MKADRQTQSARKDRRSPRLLIAALALVMAVPNFVFADPGDNCPEPRQLLQSYTDSDCENCGPFWSNDRRAYEVSYEKWRCADFSTYEILERWTAPCPVC